jgi:hypothetical protein
LHAPDRRLPYAHPAWLILILSLAPTVCLGIGSFAYSLVLPDMSDSLGCGQTPGPTATGAITDALGSLSYALNAGAAMLALAAMATAFQGRLARTQKSA